MRPDNAANRQVGTRRVHVRDEMQPPWSNPRTSDGDVSELDGDELADFRSAVDARDHFEIDLRLR